MTVLYVDLAPEVLNKVAVAETKMLDAVEDEGHGAAYGEEIGAC
jgi:hypothetical protein